MEREFRQTQSADGRATAGDRHLAAALAHRAWTDGVDHGRVTVEVALFLLFLFQTNRQLFSTSNEIREFESLVARQPSMLRTFQSQHTTEPEKDFVMCLRRVLFAGARRDSNRPNQAKTIANVRSVGRM